MLVGIVAVGQLAGMGVAWSAADPGPSAMPSASPSASGSAEPGPSTSPSTEQSPTPSSSPTKQPRRTVEPSRTPAPGKRSPSPDKKIRPAPAHGAGDDGGARLRAQTADSYAVSGKTGTGTLPSGTKVTITTTATNQNVLSAGLDKATPTAPDGLVDSGAVGIQVPTGGSTDYGERGTVTYTFSRPVRDPRLHIAGLGASPNTNIRLRLTGSTPAGAAPTWTKLAGFQDWTVSGTQISNSLDGTSGSCAFTSTATVVKAGCGTVRVDGTVSSVTLAVEARNTKGQQESDGARFMATVDEDFSNSPDLPAASHTLSDLKLGSLSTADSPDATVTAPGVRKDDDADGIASWPAAAAEQAGQTYAVDVALASPSASVLAGWVDWNGNGTLEDGERAEATPAAGATTAKLQWTIPSDAKGGTHPARIRIGHDATATKKPAGWADSGEVEDYTVKVTDAVDIRVEASDASIAPGESGDITVTTTNDGPNDAAGVKTVYEIPPGTKADTSALPPGCTGGEDGPITCVIGGLAAGQNKKHTIKLKVPADAAPGVVTGTATTSTTSREPAEWQGNNKTTNKVTITGRKIALGVKKTASPDPVVAGKQVTYTITTTNAGPSDALGTKIHDSVPANFTDVTWQCTVDGTTACGSGTGNTVDATVSRIPAGKSAVITVTGTLKAGPGKNPIKNTATATGPSGATDTNCPDKKGPCTHESVNELGTKSLKLTKTASTSTPLPGQEITYTVRVENTGSLPYPGASFEDDLSDVIDDATYVTGSETADIGTVTYAAPKLSWKGDVPAGSTATVTYKVKVDSPPKGNKVLNNAVTSKVPGTNCEAGSTDPDCKTPPGEGGIAELKFKKVSDAKSPVKPGEKVTYTVTISNPGTADYKGAKFEDDLTGVLDDAKYNNDATATSGSVSYARPKLSWSGTVPAGRTVKVTYSVTVDNPIKGDKQLKNAVAGPEGSNCEPGSKAPECTSPGGKIADLRIKKTADKTGSVKFGDTITYTVTVSNPGKADFPGATWNDDLSGVLDDADYKNDASASSGSVSYQAPKLTWSGDLPAGGSATVTYSVKVGLGGDGKLRNLVTASHGNCIPAKAATSADCRVAHQMPEVKVAKKVDKTVAHPGEKITYTVTLQNTGDTPAGGVEAIDNLTNVLDDATLDMASLTATSDPAAPVPAPSFDATTNKLTWKGDIAARATITLTYTVTVKGHRDLGDHLITNTLTTSMDGHRALRDERRIYSTTTKVATMELAKSSDAGSDVRPGDKVTYTVKVTNKGTGRYEGGSFTDDLSDLLDDARYNNDARASGGSVSYRAPELSWNGDIESGATVTITYSVTVGPMGSGDGKLTNQVTGTGPGAGCPAGSSDPDCATTPVPVKPLPPKPTPTPSPTGPTGPGTQSPKPTLPNTGASSEWLTWLAVVAGTAVLAGTGLVLRRRPVYRGRH